MTCPDLERRIDESDLSSRNRLVLKAYTRHVNPPTAKRPAPDHLIVWPSMEEVMDYTHYSLDTVRRAKRELLDDSLLEPVAGEGPWRKHTPHYRINPEKIQPNAAAIERKLARRARRHQGRHPPLAVPEKGRQTTHPFEEKGMYVAHPLPEKGYAKCPPEVSSSKERDPDKTNFLGDAPQPAPTLPEKKGEDRSRTKRTTKTAAPGTIDFTDELRAWVRATTPRVDLAAEREKFLQYCRAQGITNADWLEGFKGWLVEAHRRHPVNGHHPGSRLPEVPAPPKPVTCSFGGCDNPPCGHSQACASHACCRQCAEARQAARMAAAADKTPTDAGQTRTLLAIVAAVQEAPAEPSAAARLPVAVPPPRPLGMAPPARVSPRRLVRQLRAEDQPTYHALIEARRAREAPRQPALAAD